jgi:preprotein translocase subunit SecE
VAKTKNQRKSTAGRPKSTGKASSKATQTKKAVAKRGGAKTARSHAAQKAGQKSKAGRPAEKKGLVKFLRDVRVEMGKVTWPTRTDLAQSTLVVLVAVAIAAVYTMVLDTIFDKAIALVVNLISS